MTLHPYISTTHQPAPDGVEDSAIDSVFLSQLRYFHPEATKAELRAMITPEMRQGFIDATCARYEDNEAVLALNESSKYFTSHLRT